MRQPSIATRLVHAGERRSVPTGVPASTPIYATSSFVYETVEEVDRIVEGEVSDFVYSRYGNPTVAAFEDAMASIENGSFAIAYGSGMAALHAALLACDLSRGSVVLASKDQLQSRRTGETIQCCGLLATASSDCEWINLQPRN